MRQLLLLLIIGFTITLTSCRNDFDFEPSQGGLGFSRDTVYLDTVFTNIGSSTYTLKVYNRSDKDIKIPSIKLGQGENSKYRLMVDGMPGKSFTNVELMAKDSMFIFIETTIDYNEYVNNQTTFLYTDNIQFDSTNGQQKVELVTLVQDAVFLYPQRDDAGNYETIPISETDNTQIYGFNLNEAEHGNELIWTNTKPYVVYGYAAVPTGKTLSVNPGARVHFHANSGLIVRPGASLKVGNEFDAPTEENQVIFEGDRLEPDFAEIPGQWLAIWLQQGSTANSLNNMILKNSTVGILMEGNDGTTQTLKLKNVQIYNSTNVGILSRYGTIYGENVVINNAGEASFAGTLGGYYRFRHCTFANYFNSFNQVPVLLTDNLPGNDPADLDAVFENCILYGSSNYGFLFDKISQPGQVEFNYKFVNCFIKFADSANRFGNDPLYDFANLDLFSAGCKIAQNTTTYVPDFEDPENNKLAIGQDSAARDMADPAVSALVPVDIANKQRGGDGTTPDVGAYESTIFED